MEVFRKQMDEEILEQLKMKIIHYLKSRGFQDCDLIKNNMDKVSGLYVENLKETVSARMQFRMERVSTVKKNIRTKKIKTPSEIALDKSFVVLDENENPIEINTIISEFINTILTHELIHSASNFDGYSGIRKTNNNTALDEGMTQMFTEKIWGYTVSPITDNYKCFKKIAKILDATFGEKTSIDSYFFHTNSLEMACTNLSKDRSFYNNLNIALSSIYSIKRRRSKRETRYLLFLYN